MESNFFSFLNIKSLLFENKSFHQTILKNAAWLMFAEIIVKTASLLALIFLARYLGPASYGKVAFATSFVAVFSFIMDFGFPTLAAKEMSRDNKRMAEYVDNILVMQIILGFITLGIIALSAIFLGKDKDLLILVYLFGISNIFATFVLFLQSVFCAKEKMEYTALSKIVQGIILSLLIFLVIFKKLPILYVGYAYIASSAISMVLAFFLVRKYFSKIFLKVNIALCKKIIKNAWPIALLYFSILIFQSFDSIVIGFTRSTMEVGLYGAALKIILSTYLLLSALYSVFLPPISKAFHNKTKELKSIVEKYAKLVFGFGLPLAVGGFIVAPELIRLFYGQQYIEAIIPFQILSLNLVFIFMVSFYGYCLIFFDRQKEFLKANLIGVAINIILDLLIIPKFGIVGAACVSIIVQFSVLIASVLEFRKVISISLKRTILPAVISSFFMAIFLIIIKTIFKINPIELVFLGGLVYFLAYLCVIYGKKITYNPVLRDVVRFLGLSKW